MGYAQPADVPPLPVSGSAISTPAGEQIKVHFIDVGQADSIYIQLPNHDDILIDGGNVEDGPKVVDYLKSQGMDDDLELLIATHPHEDHIGGLPEVLAAFQVDEIIDCGLAAESMIYKQYYESAEAEQCIWLADDHQAFNLGGVELQILTGNETWADVNDYSVVVRLDCGEVEFLFTGDAEEEAESILPGDISAEIIKVGHHGSDTSTSEEFLDRVKPEVAIISVGHDNRYGQPDDETLSKMQAAGANIYRTDLVGNIIVTTNGTNYKVASDLF